MSLESEAIETLRQLTLQVMLISAGVFGIVGGFVSSSDKKFAHRWSLGVALVAFSISALFGYLLHGVLISLLQQNSFDPSHQMLTAFGVIQIALFILGGIFFTIFVLTNVSKK